ncbi:hypothetical protein AYI68_g7412, partial [Smittium mucronatum]
MEKLLQWSIANSSTEDGTVPPKIDKSKIEEYGPDVLRMIMGRPVSEQMLECMTIIEDPTVSVEDKVVEYDN